MMNYSLIASIARALLLARFRQSVVAAIGVTFSITMFIALLGFMNGLNDMLDSLVVNRTPHIRMYNEVKPNPNQPVNVAADFQDSYNFIASIKPNGSQPDIRNSTAIMQAIRQDPRVRGLAPKLTAPVLYNAGTIDITGSVSGIDVLAEMELFFFGDYVRQGNPADLKNIPNSIILGSGVGEKLLAEVGDVVQVTTAQGERLPLKVVGFFQSGIQDFDNVQSYASITTVQKMLGKPNGYITDIQVKLKDIAWAPDMARTFAGLYGTDAIDIQTANAQFETGTSIRSLISYAVGITLLVVAGFGIYNILNMMIYEKMDTIAILKATGFSGRDVQFVFLTIALVIGLAGGGLGLLLGFLLSLAIDQVPFITEALPTITTYPVNYDLKYYLIGISFSVVTTYFAGYFPAKKASQIDPVIIIRGK